MLPPSGITPGIYVHILYSLKWIKPQPRIYCSCATTTRLGKKICPLMFVCDFRMARCSYSISFIPTGYHLYLSGYYDNLPHLLYYIPLHMMNMIEEITEGRKYYVRPRTTVWTCFMIMRDTPEGFSYRIMCGTWKNTFRIYRVDIPRIISWLYSSVPRWKISVFS